MSIQAAQSHAESSVKARYLAKLLTNASAMGMALITLTFVSRALGAKNFGVYDFVTSNFSLLLSAFALNYHTAFFNWSSRHSKSSIGDPSIGIMSHTTAALAVILCSFVAMAQVSGFGAFFWPEVPSTYIWLGLVFAISTFLADLMAAWADALALTTWSELIKLAMSFFRSASFVGLFLLDQLNLTTYFTVNIVCAAGLATILFLWLLKSRAFCLRDLAIAWDHSESREYLRFVVRYAKPLAILTLAGFFYSYLDRWLLQMLSGAVHQGYFSLGNRIGTLAFLFSSAMTPVITREFANAHGHNDLKRIRELFVRIKSFVFIAAIVGVFVAVNAKDIVLLFAGPDFQAAILPVAILALCPIHQTFGQLSNAMMLATGRTKLYSIICHCVSLLGIPLVYFLLAPSRNFIPGLELGSVGLALKMLLVQLIGNNIILFFNARYLNESYGKWVSFQIVMLGSLLALGYVSAWLANGWIYPSLMALMSEQFTLLDTWQSVFRLGFNGVIFCGLVLVLVLKFPGLAGIDTAEIQKVLSKLKRWKA